MNYPFADLSLSQRLEGSEASANIAFVDARSLIEPGLGACWISVGGAHAMFDGAASPLTQSFGLGLFDEIDAARLSHIESFFIDREAPVCHEVSPLCSASLLPLLGERGYRPIECTSVMYQPLPSAPETMLGEEPNVTVRRINTDEEDVWANVSAEGWSEMPGLSEFMLNFGRVSVRSRGMHAFIASNAGMPIATGALFLHEGVALLAGASTVPHGRRLGAQQALLGARLRYAAEQGCDLAMMCAAPGSASQRNAERHGFRIAYTRTKWQLFRA